MSENKNITITFPDGNKKDFTKGISGYKIAKSISNSLANQAIAVYINDSIRDVSYPINEDSSISILKHSAD